MEHVTDLFDMEKYSEDDVLHELNKMTETEQLEYVKILEKMYYVCKSSSICKLLKRLLVDEELSISMLLRLQIIYLFENEIDERMATRVHDLLMQPSKELEITSQFDVLKFMFTHYPKYVDMFLDVLKDLLCRRHLQEDFRYRSMLESKKMLRSTDHFTGVLQTCFYSGTFSTRNKMLLCQYAMNHPLDYNSAIFAKKEIEQYLVSVLVDEEMCYENRVDVADIILNIDDMDEEWKNMAITVIDEFGRETNQFSFYHNQENVHYVDTSSIQSILEYLNHTYATQSHNKCLSSDKLKNQIFKMGVYKNMNEDERKRIHVAMVRIENDRSSYGAHGNSLSDVMQMLLTHIQHHKYKDELQKRLFEELSEMSGKCATGYVIRLVNVLSGFDDKFHVRIPPEESMKSVIFHKLNEKMFAIEDEDERSEVLYEITLPSTCIHLRRNFLKFFRNVFPTLKDEMYEQFKDDMSDTDFDLYLKRIVINYEGYETF